MQIMQQNRSLSCITTLIICIYLLINLCRQQSQRKVSIKILLWYFSFMKLELHLPPTLFLIMKHNDLADGYVSTSVYWLLLWGGIVQNVPRNCDHILIYCAPHLISNHSQFIHHCSLIWLQHRHLVAKQ
jgi:hypothetical protein